MRRIRGQSASEVSLVVSVIVLAVVAASTTMVPLFENGVRDLGGDVRNLLQDGSVGGVGGRGSTVNAAVAKNTRVATPSDVANAAISMKASAADPDLGPPEPSS